MTGRLKGYLAALAAVAWWATTGILIRYLVRDDAMPPLLLAWWRNVLMAAGLGAALAVWGRSHLAWRGLSWRFLALYGLVLAAFNAIWVLSVQASGASVATVLLYSSAAFTALFGWWMFGEPLGVKKALAVALSLGGCALVAGAYTPAAWQMRPAGIVTGLLSGFFFAAYSLMGREVARRGISPWGALFYAFWVASVFLLAAVAAFPSASGARLWPHLPTSGWAMLVGLALFPTLLGFGFYNIALGYLQASVVNLLATLEPVMTALLAYALLGERLTGVQLLGSALILTAVAAVQGEE